MKEENYSYLGFGCFFFFIVIIVIIGSVILYNGRFSDLNKNGSEGIGITINDKKKKDKDKDFVYFSMEDTVSESLNLTYKKATINLDSSEAEEVNKELEKIYDNVVATIKKSNSTDNVCENDSDLYSADYLEYVIYSNEEYITLLVTESSYSCSDELMKPQKIMAYTFNVLNGKRVTDVNLLDKYNITYTEVINKIEEQLNNNQTIVNDVSNIKIEDTLNELKINDSYVIYISDTKKLVVKYIVKTNSVDYNDIIELN